MDGRRPWHKDHAEASFPRPPKRQKSFQGDWGNGIHKSRNASPTSHDQYTIAWICALHIEMAAAHAMLDEIHETLPTHADDSNAYILGNIKQHNVVIACLPEGRYGLNNAANVLTHLVRTFPSIRAGLMVGIGGGVPSKADIRLGDIVVGTRVMQYDLGKIVGDGQMQHTAIPKIPQQLLGTAVSSLRARHEREGSRIPSIVREKFEEHSQYRRPASPDCLFLSTYDHVSQTSACNECDHSKLVRRRIRETDDPLIHYGAIASGNQVMRSGTQRDSIARQLDIICFEMEAAGLMDILPCLPIRGICDYSDSHKNKEWQRYAAAAAASYARELLTVLPVTEARVKATYMPNPYRDLSNGSQLNPAFSSIRRFADKASSVVNSPQKSLKTCHFMVPFGRNKGFVGRESILDELLKKVPPVVDEDDCQRTAIEGLGGVGKTQIALEVAHRVHDTHPDCSVFWVPAIDAASFENAYREIGQRLEISGIDDEKADIKTLVKVALSQENAGTWLLIIDNADDVQLLFSNPALCDHLPFGRNGSILFTTRNHDVTGRLDIRRRDVITVAEMDRVESIALLQQDLKEAQTCDNESMTTLLDFLADLPLTIRQASSFMAKTGITTTAYLNHCQASDKTLIKLLSRNFEDRNRYKASDNPVAATWLISFEHISRDMPLAVHYLKFMCFLAEKDIPVSLLPPADDEIDADEAIGTLKAYAFISQRDGSSSFDIHRLVQLAVRNWLEEKGERGAFIKTVIQRLAEAFLSPEHENRGVWMQYLPHAQTALESRKYCPDEEAKRSLLFGVGASNMILGKYMEAEQIYRQALELAKEALGLEHPATLIGMNNLANVLGEQGKYEEAEQMFRQTLDLKKGALGPEHPSTLTSMNNLAAVLGEQGKYEEAKQMHRQTLDLRKERLGPEHPDTLKSMNNLATLLCSQGKYKEAEQIHRQTLDLMKGALGPEHPSMLISMNNLANVLCSQGKDEEAEQIYRQTLDLMNGILGPEHPSTLTSMNNLAKLLGEQGKYEEAEQMHRKILDLRKEQLGLEHPSTLISISHIANMLHSQGKYEEAEQMHRQTLDLRKERLGPEHPDTLKSMNNLANVLCSQGKDEEAERMYLQALGLGALVLP